MGLYDNWKDNHINELQTLVERICTKQLDAGIPYILLWDLKAELKDRGIECLDNLEEVLTSLDCKVIPMEKQSYVVFNNLTIEELQQEIEKHEGSSFARTIKDVLGGLVSIFGRLH